MTYSQMPLEEAPWVVLHPADDVQFHIDYVRGQGLKVSDLLGTEDSKAVDSFVTGAQQVLIGYAKATRTFGKMSSSSFRFADLKRPDKVTSIALIADPTRMEAQKNAVALVQWSAKQEIKRSPHTEVPVHVIADEATNFKIAGLDSLLTWGRSYGMRLMVIIQDLAAFRKTYGKDATDTLLSETEIKLMLPGQRNPETIELIEKMLSQEAVMMNSVGTRPETSDYFAASGNISEDSKPLMYGNEIREMDQGILFIRRNKPALVDIVPVAAIDPLKDMLAINPFHGKRWVLPTRAWLYGRNPFSFKALWRKIKRTLSRPSATSLQKKLRYERIAKICRFLSSALLLWWLWGGIYLFAFTDLPIRVWYALNGGL
ncbi:MAG: TraM recognition domain-containing protein [Sulfitobacter sp.]